LNYSLPKRQSQRLPVPIAIGIRTFGLIYNQHCADAKMIAGINAVLVF